jgi:hypothetical protein
MSWEGLCITCQRTVELPDQPESGVLPDCPVCSSPVVALAEEDVVPWVVDA